MEHNSTKNEQKWKYLLKGKEIGPVSENELRVLLDKRKIFRTTKVYQAGMDNWCELGNLNEFQDLPPLAPVGIGLPWAITILFILSMLVSYINSDTNLVFSIGFIILILLGVDYRSVTKKGYHIDYLLLWSWVQGLTGIPIYLYKRAAMLNQSKAYFLTYITVYVLSIIMFALSFSPASSNTITYKDFYLDGYNVSLGEMVDNFISTPKWDVFMADDNNEYLNISGYISKNDERVGIVLQYQIDGNQIYYNALEIDNEPQNDRTYNTLVEQMYISVSE